MQKLYDIVLKIQNRRLREVPHILFIKRELRRVETRQWQLGEWTHKGNLNRAFEVGKTEADRYSGSAWLCTVSGLLCSKQIWVVPQEVTSCPVVFTMG